MQEQTTGRTLCTCETSLETIVLEYRLMNSARAAAKVMDATKDDDNKENPSLTLVGGLETEGLDALPEGVDPGSVDRATLQALVTSAAIDQLLLKRLKKRKLMLKDQITKIEDSLLPDIIA
jgi:hypothetical protein